MKMEENSGSAFSGEGTITYRPSFKSYPLCWLFCWVVGIPIIYMLLDRLGVSLTLSRDRLVMNKGLVSRLVVEVSYDKIQNMSIEQSVMGRILGYGTLKVATSGTEGYEIVFPGLDNPDKIMNEIKERQNAAR